MSTALLVSLFDAEVTRTATVLRAVPPASLTWAPDPRSFTLGRLAMHVASLPGWMPAFTSRDAYDMGVGGPGPPQPTSLEAILETLDIAGTRGRAALVSLDEAAWTTVWTLTRHGDLVASLTRAEAVMTLLLHHLVHHRGQLTVYLRLLGQPVPALYGDSADAALLPEAPATSTS